MRRIILCTLFCLCVSSVSFAAPCYGPQMPRQNQLFGGLQTYYIIDKSLQDGNGKMRSLQDFVLLSYGILDWLSLDLKGGFGDVKQRAGSGPDINYPTFLGGGYGFRVKLYDQDKTKVITGFQHISVHPYSTSIDGSKHKAVLDDWQFSFLVSHEFLHLTPYIGTRYSWMNQIHWVDDERRLEKSASDKNVGLILGTNIPLTQRTWINVEGQFFDATAVAGSINFSF